MGPCNWYFCVIFLCLLLINHMINVPTSDFIGVWRLSDIEFCRSFHIEFINEID